MKNEGTCPIGDEIIVDVWESYKARWAGLFHDMVEITHNGEFVVCPQTGEWLRESAPQFVPNKDNVPEPRVLWKILECAR